MAELLTLTDAGLFCEAGGFFVDPWKPVERAVITHAHADHARWGCKSYLGSREGAGVLRVRVGSASGGAEIASLGYGETLDINGVRLSLHPAGHILGSAQVRLELGGAVWVVTGDYKTGPDATCTPFEPVRCHTLITESTFGLPIYRWRPQGEVFAEINAWWRANRAAGRCSLLMGYALGKAQRLLSGLDPGGGPIFTHGAVEKMVREYRAAGVKLPETRSVAEAGKGFDWSSAVVVAPPSANGTPWIRRFGDVSAAFASGWMAVRGARRRRAVDRGFVLSDHADWPGLMDTVRATGAQRVLVTHGYSAVVVRHLRSLGLSADVLATRYEGESAEEAVSAGEE
jgi:putative mRNA 3-end processing factor